MTKRYCEGIDCAWCQEKSEPCIYKVANELQAENEKLKSRNKLYKKIIKENIEKANNNFMILTACIQGNLTVDEVKEYAKLKAKNERLKKEVEDYKQAIYEFNGSAFDDD